MPAHRLRTALAALTIALPAAAGAQDRVTWLELLSPDRIAQSVLQSATIFARSFADLTYDGLQVDLRAGRISLSALDLRPRLDWDPAGDCRITADSVSVRTGDAANIEEARGTLRATGARVSLPCLPPAARAVPALAGLQAIETPRLTIHGDYDIPSAAAQLRVFAEITDVAAVIASADAAYLSFREAEGATSGADGGDPDPIVIADLRRAEIVIDNLGGWETGSRMLPSAITDPERGGEAIAALLTQGLAALGIASDDEAAEALVASASATWPEFLEDPGRLTVETGFPPSEPVRLNSDDLEGDPAAALRLLRPVLATAPRPAREIVTSELLTDALDTPEGLSREDRERVGLALLTGDGAPRNVAAGADLLEGLVASGDGESALRLARALAETDPARAYTFALEAGAEGQAGATAILDRIERDRPMADILAAQATAAGAPAPDDGAADDLAELRSNALNRFTGRGATRSYAFAAFHARLAAAAGDAEAADILADIDAIMARTDDAGRRAWTEADAAAADAATVAWQRLDLPARLGGISSDGD